jgi:putative transposase
MVSSPEQYDWSSYCFNALGKVNPLLSPHPLYYRLDDTDEKRQHAYRSMFKGVLDAAQLNEVRAATQPGLLWEMMDFELRLNECYRLRLGKRIEVGLLSGEKLVFFIVFEL